MPQCFVLFALKHLQTVWKCVQWLCAGQVCSQEGTGPCHQVKKFHVVLCTIKNSTQSLQQQNETEVCFGTDIYKGREKHRRRMDDEKVLTAQSSWISMQTLPNTKGDYRTNTWTVCQPSSRGFASSKALVANGEVQCFVEESIRGKTSVKAEWATFQRFSCLFSTLPFSNLHQQGPSCVENLHKSHFNQTLLLEIVVLFLSSSGKQDSLTKLPRSWIFYFNDKRPCKIPRLKKMAILCGKGLNLSPRLFEPYHLDWS